VSAKSAIKRSGNLLSVRRPRRNMSAIRHRK
jgi:hypothetical protein